MPPTTAARCTTMWGRTSLKRQMTSGSTVRSCCAFLTSVTLPHPCRSSAATTCRPRKPLPPVTSTRFAERFMGSVHDGTLEHMASHHQHVHVGAQEAVERLLRPQHDRFVFVE